MDRRRMLGLAGALALAGMMGVAADAAEKTKAGKTACACCGNACACPACSCDATAKAGVAAKGWECCGGAACCPATDGKKVKTADAKGKACCEKDAKARDAKVAKAFKASCSCCGDACTCSTYTCDAAAKAGAKAGKGCDCCGGDACCTSSAGKTAKPKVAATR